MRRRRRAAPAAGKGRLEHVAGVDSPFCGSGSDQGMQLVDEENDLAVGLFDLAQDGLEAIFKFAAELGSGEHRSQVKRDDALVAQDVRDVAEEDAACEALDDGCFAHAGLADEHRVVLRAAAQHLDDATNLLVAPDDGVELATAAGELRSGSLGVFFESLELAFGVLVGDALRTADGSQRLKDGIMRGAGGEQSIDGRVAFFAREAEEQMLGGDVLILEVGRLFEGLLDGLAEPVRGAPAAPASRRHGEVFPRSDAALDSRRQVATPIFSSTGRMTPSRSAIKVSNRCTGCSSGLPSSEAWAIACCIASCDFTVSLSQRIAIVVKSYLI